MYSVIQGAGVYVRRVTGERTGVPGSPMAPAACAPPESGWQKPVAPTCTAYMYVCSEAAPFIHT